jgi:hypothetical protein
MERDATDPPLRLSSYNATEADSVRGRPRRVDDPRQTRALRQRLQAEALAELDGIRLSLTTAGRVPLSSFAGLSVRVFGELLELLAAGLEGAKGEDGTRRALSIDGSFEVILWPPNGQARTSVQTENGTFGCPDFRVSITFASSSAARDLTPIGEVGTDPVSDPAEAASA